MYQAIIFLANEKFYVSSLEVFRDLITTLDHFPVFFSDIEKYIKEIQRWKTQQDQWIKNIFDVIGILKIKQNDQGLSPKENRELSHWQKIYDSFEVLNGSLMGFLKDFQEKRDNPLSFSFTP